MAKAKIHNPRWLWITAAIVGGICTIGFVAMLLAPAEPAAPGAPAPSAPTSRGFGVGLVIGLAAGLAIGLAVRARPPADQPRDHSSRNSP